MGLVRRCLNAVPAALILSVAGNLAHGDSLPLAAATDLIREHITVLRANRLLPSIGASEQQVSAIENALTVCDDADVARGFRCDDVAPAKAEEILASLSEEQRELIVGLVIQANPKLLIDDPHVRSWLLISSKQAHGLARALERYEQSRRETIDQVRRARFPSLLAKQQFFLTRTESARESVFAELDDAQRSAIGVADGHTLLSVLR